MKIEGIVERYAPELTGHGDHGFSVLLAGSRTVYSFPGVRDAYSPNIGRETKHSAALVELTAPGDHISFETKGKVDDTTFFALVLPGTLRNWTLEHKLIGREIDITPAPIQPSAVRGPKI
jgi:hypothetical protein